MHCPMDSFAIVDTLDLVGLMVGNQLLAHFSFVMEVLDSPKIQIFCQSYVIKNNKITYLLLCLSILITSEWICILFRCSSKRILCSSGSRVLLLICHWISTLNRLIIDLTIVIFVHFLFNVLIKFILLFKSLSIKFFPRN